MTSMSLPAIGGGPNVVIEYLDPGKLLQHLVSVSPQLQEWYALAANEHRGDWSLAFLFDEYVPGDKLKMNNLKKVMNTGFNFLELGQQFYMQSLWVIPLLVRSSKISEIVGGWSNIMREFLKKQFLSASALNTAGIPLKLHGEWFLLRAQLTNICSDGDGLRIALCLRGANGLRPCFTHDNVSKKGSDLASRSAHIVEIGCHDHRKFHCQTDAGLDESLCLLKATHQRWLAGGVSGAMYTKISQAAGMRYNENGIWCRLMNKVFGMHGAAATCKHR